ncbi:MAG: hypothetical protein FWH01_17055, partial [Oscillospiraceae bacterium]|nr:hypothetical protein [Oscillospiraceae bacterium]
MRRMDTRSRVRAMPVLLFTTVLAVWTVFYLNISGYITSSAKTQMALAADYFIDRFGEELSQIERISRNLTGDEDVRALVAELDSGNYHPLTDRIKAAAGWSVDNFGFIENVIIYGAGANYYRLTGQIGNKSCTRLAGMVAALTLPSHLNAELEGRKYIGYADKIHVGGTLESGMIVILIEEERILEILRSFDHSDALMVAVTANGEVVAANTDNIGFFATDDGALPVTHSRLGITPFEIWVAAEPQYMNAPVVYFTIVAIITAAIFIAVILMYTGILNHRFFRPMLKMIGIIESLKTDPTAIPIGDVLPGLPLTTAIPTTTIPTTIIPTTTIPTTAALTTTATLTTAAQPIAPPLTSAAPPIAPPLTS